MNAQAKFSNKALRVLTWAFNEPVVCTPTALTLISNANKRRNAMKSSKLPEKKVRRHTWWVAVEAVRTPMDATMPDWCISVNRRVMKSWESEPVGLTNEANMHMGSGKERYSEQMTDAANACGRKLGKNKNIYHGQGMHVLTYTGVLAGDKVYYGTPWCQFITRYKMSWVHGPKDTWWNIVDGHRIDRMFADFWPLWQHQSASTNIFC